MFEFDAGKLIIIGIVALIVIGPKELPRVMRHVGEVLAKMRRMGAEFRGQVLEAMREAELDDIKSGVEKIAATTKVDSGDDPLAQIKAEITHALEKAGEPGIVPSTVASSLAAPQQEAATLQGAASQAMAALPSAGNSAVVDSGNLTAAGGAANSGMRVLADALAAEAGAPVPKDAGLEKA
jgi:sec-independent protein translocase protein TatB